MKLNELTASQRALICDHYVRHKCINCPFGVVVNDDYEVIIDPINEKIRGGRIECAEWLFGSELENEQISLLNKNRLLSTTE